jgi:glycosyltransferase involved in cell wall biosynthesis
MHLSGVPEAAGRASGTGIGAPASGTGADAAFAPVVVAELDISVVMPCLNEAESVGVCVAKAFQGIRQTGLAGEVVVVDNGSTDGSPEIAGRAGARVVLQPARGYGNAYRKGFAEAVGRIIVMGDSDDSYDFTQIPALIAPIYDGADYVLGSRFAGQIQRGAMTWSHRHIGNPVLTGMLNVLFGLDSSDAHSGLRAFRRESLQQMSLRCEGMEFASEIVIKAARVGLKVAEVPIVYHPRTGETKLKSLRDGFRHVRFLLALSALHVFVWPGLALFGAATAAAGLLLGLDRSDLGLRLSTAAVCVMLLGMGLVVLGLLAQTYAHSSGFEKSVVSRFLERRFTLERGLLASGSVALLCAVVAFGPILGPVGGWLAPQLEGVGCGVMFLGAELAFCSFMLALFRVPFDRTGLPGADRANMHGAIVLR